MKKKQVPVCLGLDVLTIGVLSLNKYLLNMPEVVCLATGIITVIAAVWTAVTVSCSPIWKVLLPVLAVIVLAVSILGSYCNPYWNSLQSRFVTDAGTRSWDDSIEEDEARAELKYLMKYLKKLHPALYRNMPESVQKRYHEVEKIIEQQKNFTISEWSRMLEFIVAGLDDAHTFVRGAYIDERILKYDARWSSEGWKIIAINGDSVEEIKKSNKEYYSYEVASWQEKMIRQDLVRKSGLAYMGYDAAEGLEYTLQNPDGEIYKQNVTEADFLTQEEYVDYIETNGKEKIDVEEESFVEYKIYEKEGLGYFKLDACNYNEEYTSCLQEFFEEVKKKKIKTIAVDLRGNEGGNDMVAVEFIRYLDVDSYNVSDTGIRRGFIYYRDKKTEIENDRVEELTYDGDVYVLTSSYTFSSAMLFTQYIKDNGFGTIIGEPPGNDPNGYGEISYFRLPHSKLLFQCSTKRFYRIDQDTKEKLVEPDIPCESQYALEELIKLMK